MDIGLHNHQPVRDMYRRCLDFMPVLAQVYQRSSIAAARRSSSASMLAGMRSRSAFSG